MRELKPHNPRIPFRKGFLSVQASEYNYCSPKSNHGPYSSYEVAWFNEKEDFDKIPELEPNNDQVYGWVGKEVVMELLEHEAYTPHQIKEMLPNE